MNARWTGRAKMVRGGMQAVVCALLTMGTMRAAAQEQTTPAPTSTLRVETRIVPLDIVVTDSKGRPVKSLSRDQFTVTENDEPQKIKYFEEHKSEDVKKTDLAPLPPDYYTNYPTTTLTDSVTVILVDTLNTKLEDQIYVKQQILQFLKTMQPGNRVAIFTLASKLRLLQGFTTDPAVLKAVVSDKKFLSKQGFAALNDASGPDAATTGLTDITDPTADVASSYNSFESDMATIQNEERIYLTMDALNDLGQYLVAIPGRKNLVWFAGNFPLGLAAGPTPDDPFIAMSDMAIQRRKLTDLYVRGQVSVYPASARGLSVESLVSASSSMRGVTGGTMTNMHIQQAQNDANERIPMEKLAEQTGGKAFFDTNALGKAIETAMEEGNNFYTLTYTPTNQTYDETFRRITVTIAGGNKYKLAYRRGYYADDPNGLKNPVLDPLPQKQDAKFYHGMSRGVPTSTDILFKVRVEPIAVTPEDAAKPMGDGAATLKQPVVRYAFDYAISMRALTLMRSPDGTHHTSIIVGAVAYDADGNPINSTTQDATIEMKPEVFDGFVKTGLKYTQQLDLPMEPVYLRLGVYDKISKRVGSMEIPLKPKAPLPEAPEKTTKP